LAINSKGKEVIKNVDDIRSSYVLHELKECALVH
jgi:hypothetical protein